MRVVSVRKRSPILAGIALVVLVVLIACAVLFARVDSKADEQESTPTETVIQVDAQHNN